jgi:2-keto-4-pentenoate hydratase
MTPETAERAASALLAARRNRTPLPALPQDLLPADLDEGYEIQKAFVAQTDGEVVGYKIGATSQMAQSFLGAKGPFFGRIFNTRLHESPVRLPADRFIFRLIEPEFAFGLGADLPPRREGYDRASVESAIALVRPSIEVVTCALENWHFQGVPSLVADNGVNGELVLGAPEENWRRLNLAAHAVELTVNGEPAGDGVGANALGHPVEALLWLANELSARGIGLNKGEVVTTGVVTPFVLLEAGDEAVASYGVLGEVAVSFEA